MRLSPDQKIVLGELIKWTKDPEKKQFITLGGYAGTGKTTLISILRKTLQENLDKKDKKLKVAFCSYTGRAVQVLKKSLTETNSIYSQDTISTIHGLIYSPIENDNQEIVGWKRKDEIKIDLIIIDEASMINENIWMDLLSYKVPIIAVGDHGQLPPIHGNFNLMEIPMLKLDKIHRQAEDNPIIDVATYARTTGKIPVRNYGNGVVKYDKNDEETAIIAEDFLQSYTADTIILCGYNFTRNRINQFIRTSLGFETPFPQPGDRVICQRNNRTKQIYNGMLGTIVSIKSKDDDWYDAEIEMDDSKYIYRGLIYGPQFGSPNPINFTKNRRLIGDRDLFDFGYALTVHKSQGSQAQKVILFEERFKQMNEEMWKRWLYTAVTRAREELYIVG